MSPFIGSQTKHIAVWVVDVIVMNHRPVHFRNTKPDAKVWHERAELSTWNAPGYIVSGHFCHNNPNKGAHLRGPDWSAAKPSEDRQGTTSVHLHKPFGVGGVQCTSRIAS